MTLLTIAKSVLIETKNTSIPNYIIGNTEDVAKQILQVLTTSIKELSRVCPWQELQKEYTFTSVNATEGYNLPADFDRMIDESFWNSSTMSQVSGPLSTKEWRILKNSTVSGGASYEYYRIRSNQILLFPIPASAENYVYEYISNKTISSSSNVLQSTWLADTDFPLIDEYIVILDAVWRWLMKNGRPYAEEKKICDSAIAERVKNNGARMIINHPSIYNNNGVKIAYPNIITP